MSNPEYVSVDEDGLKLKELSIVPFADVTLAQGATALWNFMFGGTVGAGDTMNTVHQALTTNNTGNKVLGAAAATANIAGIGAGSTQMFQQFSQSNAKAGALAGSITSSATKASFYVAAGSILYTAADKGVGEITSSQLSALSATILGAVALSAAPEVAIALGVLAGGLTAYSWSGEANHAKVGDLLNQLKGMTLDYLHRIPIADQATLTTSMQSVIQTTLNGGITAPRLNSDGLISGYSVEIPTSITAKPDGSTRYTFASGAALEQNSLTQGGTLNGSGTDGRHDVWSVSQTSGDKVTIVVYKDGTFSDVFKDTSGQNVSATNINGSSGNYSVSGSGSYDFITVAGNNSLLYGPSGSFVNLKGSGNTANVANGTILVASNGTIKGNNNAVSAADHSTTVLYGTGYVVNLVSNSGSWLHLGADASATINGSGNGVGVLGSNAFAVSSSNTFNFSVAGVTVGINGNNNTINPNANSWTNLNGQNNFVNFTAYGGSTVNFIPDNATLVTTGSGNRVGICGTNDYVVSSSNTIVFSRDGLTTGIGGDSNTIDAKAAAWINLNGQNNTVNFAQYGGSTINFLTDNARLNTTGAGNTVGLCGTNDYLVSSGNSIVFARDGLVTGIEGNSNVINAKAASWTNLHGQDNTVNFAHYGGSTINFLTDNARLNTTGAGNTVGLCGTNDYLVSSGNSIVFARDGLVTGIEGNSNIINAKAASWTNLNGENNTVNFAQYGGATLNLYSDNARVNTTGAGNTVGLCGTNNYLVSSNNNIAYSRDGLTAAVEGNSNTINAAGHSTTNLYGFENTVNLRKNSGALVNVNGWRNTATINGEFNAVSINENEITIRGNKEAIRLSRFGLAATIQGDSNAIVGENALLNVSGRNVTIGGKSNVINAADHSTVYIDSPNSTVNGNNLTIIIGAGVKGSNIHINGNHNAWMTDGYWSKNVHDLAIYTTGDFGYNGFTGVNALYGAGYHQQSYQYHPYSDSFGALNAPPLTFPHFDTLSAFAGATGASNGGLDTGYLDKWTHNPDYDLRHVHIPVTLEELADYYGRPPPSTEEIKGQLNVIVIGVADQQSYYDINGHSVEMPSNGRAAIESYPSGLEFFRGDPVLDIFLANIKMSSGQTAPPPDLGNVANGAGANTPSALAGAEAHPGATAWQAYLDDLHVQHA